MLSFVIGFGPLIARRPTVFLIAGVAMALDFWVLGEALGQVFSGIATDPNTGPLLVLLALALYPAGVPATAREPLSPAFTAGTGSLAS